LNDLLYTIAAQLRHLTPGEIVTLVCDFVGGLDEKQQTRFLNLVVQGPRPLVAEAMGLDDADDLLEEIEALRDAIANDVYVEYGVGYDPEYGTHRGFGDDSWIDEMDDLFAAATGFFRAGQFKAATDAYVALFNIFRLSEDDFHFTRPEPDEALHTDVDAMKENLFIAIARSASEPAVQAIEVSEDLHYYGANRYALLDAWQGRGEWMTALEADLVVKACCPTSQDIGLLSHFAELLREFYRRYRDLPAYETLCRAVGPQQGWPYKDLVGRYREQENWEQVLTWTVDGLEKLPAESRYRPFLQEARGKALIGLGRPVEALDALLALFQERRWEVLVYLKLRQTARAVGRWEALYPQLTAEMQAHVVAIKGQSSYPVVVLTEACLLGYAYLLEGDWKKAIEWATTPGIPAGWRDDDLTRTVATGLLRMGLVAQGESEPGDETLAQTLHDAPRIIREHGELLEPVAHTLPADQLLDGAVRLYERLVEWAIGGRGRGYYAEAGAFCRVIRTIRCLQGRETDFKRYYQGLFVTYSRLPALKDELRKAIEGSGCSSRQQR
jgi:tetratricopeptide (TPR) repeat protein